MAVTRSDSVPHLSAYLPGPSRAAVVETGRGETGQEKGRNAVRQPQEGVDPELMAYSISYLLFSPPPPYSVLIHILAIEPVHVQEDPMWDGRLMKT